MQNQMEYFDDFIMKYWEKYKEAVPSLIKPHNEFTDKVYDEGELPAKMKRLIALGIALRAGCDGCIIAQTKRAVEAGATKGEVLEAVAVGLSMGGTPAAGWLWRVIKVLEDMGKW